MPMRKVTPTHFATPAAFRRWLARNHAKATEIFLGFYRKASGKGGLTYADALDEALCYGWIDGVRLRVNHEVYAQRFSPRTSTSYWSAVNIEKAKALQAAGRMMPPGLAAFERRDEARAARYSFEARTAEFDAPSLKTFRSHRKAWAYYSARPPGYRRLTTHWVMSAKQQATRDKRLAMLIDYSAQEQPIPALAPASTRKA